MEELNINQQLKRATKIRARIELAIMIVAAVGIVYSAVAMFFWAMVPLLGVIGAPIIIVAVAILVVFWVLFGKKEAKLAQLVKDQTPQDEADSAPVDVAEHADDDSAVEEPSATDEE